MKRSLTILGGVLVLGLAGTGYRSGKANGATRSLR